MKDVALTTDAAPSLMGDLVMLTKARLTTLVLVTTFVGYCLVHRETFGWLTLLHVLLGTGLVAGGASVLNQTMEREQDRVMNRTKDRPLPAGRMGMAGAILIGIALSVAGCLYLLLAVNLQSALLAALTLAIYILVYTPLKRLSTTCTLVGAVSGAIPPVIGWVGGGGGLTKEAALLFAILFFWQLPHFLAINWVYREDYERAGFKMWSNHDESGVRTSWLALLFTLPLLVVTLLPTRIGMLGHGYFFAAAVLGLAMLFCAVAFVGDRTTARARTLFFCSIFYLPLLLGAMLLSPAP